MKDLVCTHLEAAKAAVSSLPDAKWREKPLALVVKRAEEQVGEKQPLQHIHGFIDKGVIFKQVERLRVIFAGASDKTSVGKINKWLL